MAKAISTYKSFLMHSSDGKVYTKLIDVKDFPALGADPNMIDVTTLSDNIKQQLPGIQEIKSLDFTANYTPENFQTVKALEGKEEHFAMWFGGTEGADGLTPTGSDGKFDFTGIMTAYVNSGKTNAALEIKMSIAITSRINFTYTPA